MKTTRRSDPSPIPYQIRKRPARFVRCLDPFKPTFLKRDADSLCELQASRLRSEVGSREARRRQPTCHSVQVLIGSPRPERGSFFSGRCLRFFGPFPMQGLNQTPRFCFFMTRKLHILFHKHGAPFPVTLLWEMGFFCRYGPFPYSIFDILTICSNGNKESTSDVLSK